MRFTEINLFGVYVAPMSLMMAAAWVVAIGLRLATGMTATVQIDPRPQPGKQIADP